MSTKTKRLSLLGLWPAALLVIGGCINIHSRQANKELRAKLGKTSFTIFPTFLRTGGTRSYDAASAASIAAFIAQDKLGDVVVSKAEVPIPGGWHHNEAAMLKESVVAFKTYLADHPAKSDYAVMAEFLRHKKGRQASGIHCSIIDGQGRIAYALLMNSHYKPFARANLTTPEACTDLLISVLRKELSSRSQG